MIGIQSLLDTRFLQGISQPFDRRPCQILSTSCRSELVAIVNLVDDNADIQQIEVIDFAIRHLCHRVDFPAKLPKVDPLVKFNSMTSLPSLY